MVEFADVDAVGREEDVLRVLGDGSGAPGDHQRAQGAGPDVQTGKIVGEREREVLRLIAAGHSNEQIANELILAVGTVKWYIRGIYGKLEVHSRTQAVARASELRLLRPLDA